MELRIGFTIVPGNEGWQFPPIQYLRVYQTEETVNLESLKADLQDIMTYAENKLQAYKKVSKDDAIIKALQAIASTQGKLTKE